MRRWSIDMRGSRRYDRVLLSFMSPSVYHYSAANWNPQRSCEQGNLVSRDLPGKISLAVESGTDWKNILSQTSTGSPSWHLWQGCEDMSPVEEFSYSFHRDICRGIGAIQKECAHLTRNRKLHIPPPLDGPKYATAVRMTWGKQRELFRKPWVNRGFVDVNVS